MKATGLFAGITLLFLLSLFSCNIINPSEEIPAYIRIDTFKVITHDLDQGSASHMIGDIWISVGGSQLGVFTMPFTIPSLAKGQQTITLSGGIKNNGISASRIRYPFFKSVTEDVNLVEGEIHIFNPVSEYKEECVFRFNETFEDPGVNFIYPNYSDTTFVIQKEVVKEGRSSGAIYLSKKGKVFEAYIDEDMELPENATAAFLEFDYKNTNGFQVGMYLIKDGAMEWYGLVYVRPSETWKRYYVDLGTVATYQHDTDLYRISFQASHEQADSLNMGEVYLDNIKIIHF